MYWLPGLLGHNSRYFTLRKLYLLNDDNDELEQLEQFECKYCGSIIVDDKISIEIDNECIEQNRISKLKYEEDMKIYGSQLRTFKNEVEKYKEIINTHNIEIDKSIFKRMFSSKWGLHSEQFYPEIVISKSEIAISDYHMPVEKYTKLSRPIAPQYSEILCKYITCLSCKRKNYFKGKGG